MELRNLFQIHDTSLNRFVTLLKNLAEVFQLAPEAIHIFYDHGAIPIAFNNNNALFFNLKFYLEYHHDESKIKFTMNTMIFWFILICHELAHNLVAAHNSIHEVSMISKFAFFNIFVIRD